MKQLTRIISNVTYEKVEHGEEPNESTTMEPLFEIGLVIGEKEYTQDGSSIQTKTQRFYMTQEHLTNLGNALIEMAEQEELQYPIIINLNQSLWTPQTGSDLMRNCRNTG